MEIALEVEKVAEVPVEAGDVILETNNQTVSSNIVGPCVDCNTQAGRRKRHAGQGVVDLVHRVKYIDSGMLTKKDFSVDIYLTNAILF